MFQFDRSRPRPPAAYSGDPAMLVCTALALATLALLVRIAGVL